MLTTQKVHFMLTKQFILNKIPSFEMWFFRRLPFHQNHLICRFIGDSKFESVLFIKVGRDCDKRSSVSDCDKRHVLSRCVQQRGVRNTTVDRSSICLPVICYINGGVDTDVRKKPYQYRNHDEYPAIINCETRSHCLELLKNPCK